MFEKLNDENSAKIIEGNLSILAPKDWFSELNSSSIWLRIYSIFGISSELLNQHFAEISRRYNFDVPVAVGCGIRNLKVPNWDLILYSNDEGITNLHIKSEEKDLFGQNYLCLRVPHKIDGVEGNESISKRRLNSFSALITLHCGVNLLRHLVFEAEINAATGQYNHASDAVKMPQASEGPFLAEENWKDIDEISKKISGLTEPVKGRISLSLQYFHSASHGSDSFFKYWVALEILCNGKSQRIRERIKLCYNLPNVVAVDNETGFRVISGWRHAYFHRGEEPTVWSSDIERYIQILYLDLLRFEIGLEFKGHLVGYHKASGYNLSPLGLSDNRTQEQKDLENRAFKR